MEGIEKKEKKEKKAPRFNDEQKFELWQVLGCHRDTLAELTVDEAIAWINANTNPKLSFELTAEYEGSLRGTAEAMRPPLFFKRRKSVRGNQHTKTRAAIIARLDEVEKKLSQPLTGYIEIPKEIQETIDGYGVSIRALRADINGILRAFKKLEAVDSRFGKAIREAAISDRPAVLPG